MSKGVEAPHVSSPKITPSTAFSAVGGNLLPQRHHHVHDNSTALSVPAVPDLASPELVSELERPREGISRQRVVHGTSKLHVLKQQVA